MILGIGTDMCDVRRIEQTLERFGERFLNRVFTPVERERSDRRQARAASYAKRFAAKEACAKALGTGIRMGIAWKEMGVVNLRSGQPTLVLTGAAAERLRALCPAGHAPHIHLTITDDYPFAQAQVIIEARPVETAPQAAASLPPPAQVAISVEPAGDETMSNEATRLPPTKAADKTVANKSAANKNDGGAVETIKVVVQALLIALVVRTFLFQPFNIPSGSLVPTLLVGDYLFVSKYTYGYSKHSFPFSAIPIPGRIWAAEPKRGDIAVFKLPKDNETDYIKRVIGLPGDRIQMINGILHINGTPVKREPLPPYETVDKFGHKTSVPAYTETLPNGVRHMIIEKDGDNGYWDNTFEYVVPKGHFFMMGDNRDNSTDSRDQNSVGYVPFENFVGRAEVIFFSVEEGSPAWEFWRWPQTVRLDRLFKLVR